MRPPTTTAPALQPGHKVGAVPGVSASCLHRSGKRRTPETFPTTMLSAPPGIGFYSPSLCLRPKERRAPCPRRNPTTSRPTFDQDSPQIRSDLLNCRCVLIVAVSHRTETRNRSVSYRQHPQRFAPNTHPRTPTATSVAGDMTLFPTPDQGAVMW